MPSSVESRALIAGALHVGVVYTYAGRPVWMFVSVDLAHGPSTMRCVVETAGGVAAALREPVTDRADGVRSLSERRAAQSSFVSAATHSVSAVSSLVGWKNFGGPSTKTSL